MAFVDIFVSRWWGGLRFGCWLLWCFADQCFRRTYLLTLRPGLRLHRRRTLLQQPLLRLPIRLYARPLPPLLNLPHQLLLLRQHRLVVLALIPLVLIQLPFVHLGMLLEALLHPLELLNAVHPLWFLVAVHEAGERFAELWTAGAVCHSAKALAVPIYFASFGVEGSFLGGFFFFEVLRAGGLSGSGGGVFRGGGGDGGGEDGGFP